MTTTRACPFGNIFGKPNEGIHRYRLFGLAIVDVLLTMLVIWWLHWMTKYDWRVLTIVVLAMMVAAHRLCNVRTVTDRLLFP
jgi:hypothetical protein